ncbi:Long-chain-fatty-acid--CoA ligase 5 [Rhizoclosmatium hyalinum]|nr:Long-chain-fatty-acid--CoA ligase 5 [Rhizoclosmatium hyalinum]
MFVYGDSLRSSLVGVVVLDPETCIPIARKLGLLPSDTPDSGVILPGAPVNPHVKSLTGNAEFKKFVLEEMRQVANAAGLVGFECVKNVYLEAEAFSIENDLLTPTMKLKRVDLLKKYSSQIVSLYAASEHNGGQAKL